MQQLKNGIYLTEGVLEALYQDAANRTPEGIAKASQEIYEELKKRYKQLNKEGAAGVDSIIYTVERKLGKTDAVIALAEELGITIVYENLFRDMYRNRREDINVISVEDLENPTKWEGKRFNFHTVLVDSPTDVKRVRAAINGIVQRTLCPVNILGVQ